MRANTQLGLGLLFLLLVADAYPDDWAGRLVGRWTHQDRVLEFMGGGVGRDTDGGGRFFCFVTTDPSQLQINWGGGSTETHAVHWAGADLLLSAGGTTNRFSPAARMRSTCETNLLSLQAAKEVFLRDNPGTLQVSLSELVPAYLAVIPACGSNASYSLGPMHMKPSCSEHGALSE